MGGQRREPQPAGQRPSTSGVIGRNRTAVIGLDLRGMPLSRRSMIGVGQQGEQSWLKVAPRRRALRFRSAIVFQLEQGKLPCLFGPPCLKLLATEFANPPPAKGVAIDHDGVGLRHDTSRSVGLGNFLQGRVLQAVQEIRCALRVRRGGKDRPLVVLEDLNPRRDIGGVVVPDLGG